MPDAFSFDPHRAPPARDRILFVARKAYAKWKWRNYAREDRAFIARLERAGVPLRTVWDIGASNGAWSMMVDGGGSGLQHHLFEPLAGHVESYAAMLSLHLAANPGWTLHPVAIGSADGTATIFADQASYGSSLIESDFAKQHWRSIEIAVRAGDSLIAAGEAPRPDIVKADTQGFELEVLKGLDGNLPEVKALLLETWLSRGYGPSTPLLTELIDWLKPRGFVPVEFADGYRDAEGHQRSVDAFFLRRDLAELAGFSL